MVVIEEDDYLAHYGILRKSGRYPWGSGKDVPTRSRTFLDWLQDMRKQGLTESEIAKGVGMSTTDLRALNTIARDQHKQSQITQAQILKDKGYSNVAIAERMGLPGESSVRALLAPGAKEKSAALTSTADMLKAQVAEKQFVDVGVGVENYLGVSKERLGTSVSMLKAEGYELHTVKVPQLGTSHETEMKVLCPPGTTWGDVRRNVGNIKSITTFSEDNGQTFAKVHPPIAVNPKRVGVKYAEEGGAQADGVIYVRPGIKDVSIGNASYAQVRIQVGSGHYLKGMAMYKDDLPDGVDLLFNTNKSNTGNKLDVMKELNTKDPDLPFSSVVRQIVEHAGSPKERVTSAMNIVGTKEGSGEEGAWDMWSKTLSSQMLSKQSPKLARQQLAVTYERRQRELNEILSLTNPTIKKKLLEGFADSTDSAAVHLKAAAMPRQQTRVLLPINSMSPNEVYAPTFRNGERVVLIRYPHGGTFEIPELTVNNRHAEAKKLLGNARDAIGIHHSVAERLSGADFDGDTVLVIPNNHPGRIKTSPALDGLKNFDPKATYPPHHGMKTIDGGTWDANKKAVDYGDKRPSSRVKGIEMGKVSNLITDMTIKGAPHKDIVRAVRHSMVVIDAEKHHLNYKESAIRNGITQLKREYQGKSNAGASTLISRASAEKRVPEFKPRPQKDGGPVDKATGKRVFVETGKTRLTKDGAVVPRLRKVERLAVEDDAHKLSSGTPMETIYANHSNSLKELANRARLESINTPRLKYSKSAKQTYSSEVSSLNAKLALAERNAPRERQAQVVANAQIKARLHANPEIEAATRKKLEAQALETARARMGARKQRIEITQQEWDAIQAGAVSNSRLERILSNADLDVVRNLATPRLEKLMTPSITKRAQSMLNSGYTRAEVADQLGVSLTTLDTATNE